MADDDTFATMSATDALEPLMERCIRPNADALVAIVSTGDIALALLEPSADWAEALELGSDVTSHVMRLPGRMRRQMIEHSDAVTARWLRGHRLGRVFVVMGAASLLLNFANGAWTLEPNATNG